MNDRVQQMARAYVERGLSYAQIGEEFGLTRQRVGQLLGPLGLAKNRGRINAALRQQNLQAAHAKILAGEATLEEMAKQLGIVHPKNLKEALARIGLVLPEKGPPPHGTLNRYQSRRWRCRCELCTRANRDRTRSLKGQEPPTHGYSGYINYGCRCKVCKEANRLAVRSNRAAHRRRKEVNA